MPNSYKSDGFTKLFNQLDNSQHDAVFHSHGPALVVAGPGSGKTSVILCRVWYLISQCQVMPSQILVLTFTKAAANSLQSRFFTLSGNEYFSVSFGTFHSFFYQILRQYGSYKDSTIITTKEKYAILRQLGINDIGLCKDILYAIGCHLNNPFADIEEILAGRVSKKIYEEILFQYLETLKTDALLDFDQIAELTAELLRTNEDILSKIQKQYSYILVDEFQDTNPMQYECVKLLTQSTKNLFVVGDDDQAIYSFRGSFPTIMKQISEDYEYLRTYYLSTNYRCMEKIVKASNTLISFNKNRLAKEIASYEKGEGNVNYICFETSCDEYRYVAERIKEIRNYYDWKDMAIIARTNKQLVQIRGYLEKESIPFSDGSKQITKVSVVTRDLIEIIEYILGITSKATFWRRIEKDMHKSPFFWRDKHARLFMNYLCRETTYLKRIEESIEKDELKKEVSFLIKESEKYKTLQSFVEYLKTRKKEETCLSEGVSLLTMHGAKGLEFSYVALIDINEGIIPGKACVLPEQIEEERRMLYVGMTRAKKILDICYLKGGKKHPRFVSRFLNPLLGLEKED